MQRIANSQLATTTAIIASIEPKMHNWWRSKFRNIEAATISIFWSRGATLFIFIFENVACSRENVPHSHDDVTRFPEIVPTKTSTKCETNIATLHLGCVEYNILHNQSLIFMDAFSLSLYRKFRFRMYFPLLLHTSQEIH
jgi:hypothetical protein